MFRFAVCAAALAVRASAQAIASGASLIIDWCDSSNPLQQFTVGASTVTDASGALCVTMSSPYPAALTMQPCAAGAATQAWSFNTSGAWPLAFTAPTLWQGGCALWNTQGGPGYERSGSTVGVYACSSPTPFDSVFAVGVPAAGLVAATMTEPGNQTFSNLCMTAVNPLPPPLPTPAIVDWAEAEMACFVHWNMATAAGTQGCGGCQSAPPPISIWHPAALSTDAWLEAGVAMGCKRFVYVAKHGCGFAAWPSNATVNGERYPYSVAFAPNTTDVVSSFVASAKAAGVGYGFYYSVGSNALCNVQGGNVCGNPVAGQLNVTKQEFDNLVIQQLTELWGAFGPLAEVWFDGGYTPDQAAGLKALFASLQPNVVAFGAAGLCASPARWVGTEDGFAPYPCWSTVANIGDDGAGDPDGALWVPAETDFTLQNGDNWFYSTSSGVHTFAQLQDMYETSVGHNTAIIVDFAPRPDGSLPPEQVAVAAALGNFVAACYGAPIVQTSGNASVLTLMPSAPVTVDRVLVSENQRAGQLVRAFAITALLANGSTVELARGTSVGNKFIAVLPAPVANVASLTLNITALAPMAATPTPVIKAFAAFACDAAAEEQRAALHAAGFEQPPASTAAQRAAERARSPPRTSTGNNARGLGRRRVM